MEAVDFSISEMLTAYLAEKYWSLMNSKEIKYADFKPGQYYHVYNRAIGKERLFYSNENYSYFLRKYHYHLNGYLKTYAYCLMPNHFHLLIRINDGIENVHETISNQFRRLFVGYVNAINIQQKRKGGLFIKPFKRKLITDQDHLSVIVNYIHSNPVHHNLCSHPSLHLWNSYNQVLLGVEEKTGMSIVSSLNIDKNTLKREFSKELPVDDIEFEDNSFAEMLSLK